MGGGREEISPAIIHVHSMGAARRCYMTDKELRGLSRRDLLELLVAREKENQQLRQELEQDKNYDAVLARFPELAELACRRSDDIFEGEKT